MAYATHKIAEMNTSTKFLYLTHLLYQLFSIFECINTYLVALSTQIVGRRVIITSHIK